MLVVKIDDLNNIKVEPEEVHPMYSPISYNAGYNQVLKDIKEAYNAGYNQALKDIKEAYNGLTVYDTDTKVFYLCDKNKPDCKKTNCSEEFCCHTTDVNHAINFYKVTDKDIAEIVAYVEKKPDRDSEVPDDT